MASKAPRILVVTRPTPYELLIARHGTVQQARFFLETRDQSIEPIEIAHRAQQESLGNVLSKIPVAWRRGRVGRDDLDRFLFEDDDIIVAVGQDGLVANMAKYLTGQPVVGINPLPDVNAGVLVPHRDADFDHIVGSLGTGRYRLQHRTMVEAEVGGFKLRALNELFIGHQTHQSARYSLRHEGFLERHSSSGVVVSTGTGATGWARSIRRERACALPDVSPEDRHLLFFVREAFPSPGTGCDITSGVVQNELEIVSEMNEGGVIFGDGIETDRIDFGWGRRATIRVSDVTLNLVV